MSEIGTGAVLAAFTIFCRVGACLMLMPGLSSARVPVNVRLFLALAVALAITPLLSGEIEGRLSGAEPLKLTLILLSELLIGGLIGFLGRIYFGALETLGGVIAMSIGLSSPMAAVVGEGEADPSVTNFLTLAATVLFFVTDLQWEVVRGLVASYAAVPVSGQFQTQFNLIAVSDNFSRSFVLALRISSPFIVYSLIINFAIGLASKLTPQIPLYFVTVPAIAFGGLWLLYVTCRPFLELFLAGFRSWLETG